MCFYWTVEPCGAQPCVNNGVCSNVGDKDYSCDCPDGYQGKNCESEGMYMAMLSNSYYLIILLFCPKDLLKWFLSFFTVLVHSLRC